MARGRGAPAPTGQSLDEALADYERSLIAATLERNHYSVGKTADQLKVSRHALRYRMQRLNITTESSAEDEAELAAGKEATSDKTR